jgi:hypothetical protein
MQQWLLLAHSAFSTKTSTTTAILSGRVAIVLSDFARVAQAHSPEEASISRRAVATCLAGKSPTPNIARNSSGRHGCAFVTRSAAECLSRVALLKASSTERYPLCRTRQYRNPTPFNISFMGLREISARDGELD